MKSPRWVGVVLATALLTSGCAFGPPNDEQTGSPPRFPTPTVTPSKTPDASVAAQVIVKGLAVPWGVAFLPDGTALVTERDSKRILKVGPKTTDSGELTVTPVQTVDEVAPRGEGGLMGIAVSPKYDEDQTVYIYYTTAQDNRIAKLKLGGKPEPIVTGIPVGENHDGGALAFGPDGFLYAATGDGTHSETSQDKASLGGKILRMTPEGKAAPGNPFGDTLVYSYGHRDVEGLAWDSQQKLYATEFGQDAWDEINYIEPGKNYGWPTVEGVGGKAEFTDPIQVWKPAEASCSGAAVSDRALVVGCLRGKRLWVVSLNGTGGTLGQPVPLLNDKYGRLRAVVRAPDGTLWVTTSNKDRRGTPVPEDDRILRVVVGGGGVGKS